jgi:hypothetical protein
LCRCGTFGTVVRVFEWNWLRVEFANVRFLFDNNVEVWGFGIKYVRKGMVWTECLCIMAWM